MIRIDCDKCGRCLTYAQGGQDNGNVAKYWYECECGYEFTLTITPKLIGALAHPVEKCSCSACRNASIFDNTTPTWKEIDNKSIERIHYDHDGKVDYCVKPLRSVVDPTPRYCGDCGYKHTGFCEEKYDDKLVRRLTIEAIEKISGCLDNDHKNCICKETQLNPQSYNMVPYKEENVTCHTPKEECPDECDCLGNDEDCDCRVDEPAYPADKIDWEDSQKCAASPPKKKYKLIISCNGIDKDERKRLEKELNDPDGDKYVWIFNKPVTVNRVEDY